MALYEVTDTRSGERFLTEQPGPRQALKKALDGRFVCKIIKSPMEAVISISTGAINLDETSSPANDAGTQADAGTIGAGEGGLSDPVPVEGALNNGENS